jgi:hypothetical protein
MTVENCEQDRQVLFYRNTVEKFYLTIYPQADINNFWVWFNGLLLGIPKNIIDLDSDEKAYFLKKLNDLGDSLFESLSIQW